MNDPTALPNTCPLGDEPLVAAADHLRSLHVAGDPLVLVNVWDVASAVEVHAAGAAAIGTSSAAIAAVFGEPDTNSMPICLAFGAIKRIAGSVPVPVTADVEGGYGLDGSELVGALLAAGAVGCNLEDSDHDRPGTLLDVDVAAGRLAAVRRAADEYGVPIVINARIDAYLHAGAARDAATAEIIRRGHAYLEAGADCLYPIGLTDPVRAGQLVEALGAPINGNVAGTGTIADMTAAGVSRVSFGPRFQRQALADLRERAGRILSRPGVPR
ncbi:isocitrate lyase/PEP mutase family protein [Desertimonas flava]|uniref:isocitrate lyase/PEP mutase family protein n=1 Tax=Desertimonas flava TaxID=2064846 RepID=UPI000E3537CD|nr:isocitrate lyase/phosphoenolpyruvate mutase family protein [Desertimonas flava]